MEAREEEVASALLIPLVIVFYSSEDVLKDSSLGILRKVFKYFVYRIIEIILQSPYAHVQCYSGGYTNHVPRNGSTRVYQKEWFTTPFSIAYIIHPTLLFSTLIHIDRPVSLWKNIKWALVGGRMPINCISDAEMILRFHCTKDSEHACKVRRYCRSIGSVEEAIRNYSFGWNNPYIAVSDERNRGFP